MKVIEDKKVIPLLKWVGGKRELIPELSKYYSELSFNNYIEPFFGGGSVYLDIIKRLPNFEFVNAIHPSVIIGNGVNIGYGVVAMAGVIFNPKASIGNFTFFATGAQIEHDCVIDDYSSISAGSLTGGHVHMGKFSALTLGVVVLDRLSIGENTVVGAGSVVIKSLPANVLAYGNPAKIIRNREQNEKFLK